jgi:uncharacterized protein (DUF111 family)
MDGVIVNAQPEYEDVANVATRSGQPIKMVLAEALAAAFARKVSPPVGASNEGPASDDAR